MKRFWEAVYLKTKLGFSGGYWRDNTKGIFATAFFVLGVFWLVLQIADHFLKDEETFLSGPFAFWGVILGSLLFGVLYRSPKLVHTSRVNRKDVTISLRIGDMLLQDGSLVITTNTTFDTSYDRGFISKDSVQGKLIAMEYDELEQVDTEIENELSGQSFEEIGKRETKTKKYPVGTVIKLDHRSGRRTYWLALSDVNKHGKPKTEHKNIFVCLQELWAFIEDRGHMDDVFLPIIGTGKSGLDMTRSQIIEDIILSFLHYTQNKRIVDSITICIFPDDLKRHDIDISKLSQYMDYQCQFAFSQSDFVPSSTSLGKDDVAEVLASIKVSADTNS